MNTTFEQCIELIGVHEGGYSSDRSDRGNWSSGKVGVGVFLGSKFGISGMSYPTLDIKNLTWDQAKAIYKRDFWDKYRIGDLAPSVRLFTFDSCINHGPSAGIKILQRSIGVKADGVVGRETVGQSHKATPWKFAESRSDYYSEIIQNGFNDENDIKQIKGWLRRNLRILQQSIV